MRGYGTNGEKNYNWLHRYKPYFNETLRTIKIDDNHLISLDNEIPEKTIKLASNGLKLLDGSYNKKDLNLYYDLAALNPLEK